MARKSKFSDNQIVTAVKEVEAGASAKEVARKMGVSYAQPLEAEVQWDDRERRAGEAAAGG